MGIILVQTDRIRTTLAILIPRIQTHTEIQEAHRLHRRIISEIPPRITGIDMVIRKVHPEHLQITSEIVILSNVVTIAIQQSGAGKKQQSP